MSKLNFSTDQKQSNTPTDVSRLNSQTHLNEKLEKLRSYLIQSDARGLPRFGILSILARRVPFYLYDHPAFVILCDTAFTDGVHIFIHTEFFKELQEQDAQRDAFGLTTHSTILILLHELSHILFRHHIRLPPKMPPLLWAIACDIAINCRLIKGYPKLKPGPVFKDAWGSSASEIERYFGQSEEHIASHLWQEPLPEAQPFISQLKQQMDSQSDSPNKEIEDSRGKKQDIHHHLVDLRTVAKTLDENGLQHVRQKLSLPDPNDKPAFNSLFKELDLQTLADFDQAEEIRQNHPAGDAMSGEHLERSYGEWIEDYYRGQLEWKNLLRDLIVGSGNRYEHSDELPADIFYVPPEEMHLDMPIYIGSHIPAGPEGDLLFIIDTSKSVREELLKTFLGELNAVVKHEDVQQANLIMMTADTAIRGDVLNLMDQGIDELPKQLLMHGRGGTQITKVIQDALQWCEEQHVQLEALVYLSDLLDRPPQRNALPNQLPKLLFLSPPSLQIKSFQSAVSDFATVAQIRENTIIDMNKITKG